MDMFRLAPAGQNTTIAIPFVLIVFMHHNTRSGQLLIKTCFRGGGGREIHTICSSEELHSALSRAGTDTWHSIQGKDTLSIRFFRHITLMVVQPARTTQPTTVTLTEDLKSQHLLRAVGDEMLSRLDVATCVGLHSTEFYSAPSEVAQVTAAYERYLSKGGALCSC